MLAEEPAPPAGGATGAAGAPTTTSTSTTGPASTASLPSSSAEERRSFQSRFNDFVHEDYVSDVFYYVFWA